MAHAIVEVSISEIYVLISQAGNAGLELLSQFYMQNLQVIQHPGNSDMVCMLHMWGRIASSSGHLSVSF